MKGEIIKIIKKKSIYGQELIQVHFKLEDKSIGILYLVPEYRNFERWKKFLKVGKILNNLKILSQKENGVKIIDGDSNPTLTEEEILSKFVL